MVARRHAADFGRQTAGRDALRREISPPHHIADGLAKVIEVAIWAKNNPTHSDCCVATYQEAYDAIDQIAGNDLIPFLVVLSQI